MLQKHDFARYRRIAQTLYPTNIIKRKLDKYTRPSEDACEEYHKWYYNTRVMETTKWAGTLTLKSPSDMWNYQEIIFDLKPSLIVEFGTRYGGSAMFFSGLLQQFNPRSKVLSVDIDHQNVAAPVKSVKNIELMLASSTSPEVAERIRILRKEFPGPVFAILDSEHAMQHVLAEMILLRDVLTKGDYVIVEDGNINGHPVAPGSGDGPYEAIERYFELYPHDYRRDETRENKFGFTFAPRGFLIKN